MIPFIDFFFFFLIYIFLNSIVLLCSTFHLLPLFLFHLNFHINLFLLHFHLSSLFLPSFSWPKKEKKKRKEKKESILSLSLSLSFSNFVSLLVDLFIVSTTFFFLLMVLFVIVNLIVASHLYWLLCIFRYFDISILSTNLPLFLVFQFKPSQLFCLPYRHTLRAP